MSMTTQGICRYISTTNINGLEPGKIYRYACHKPNNLFFVYPKPIGPCSVGSSQNFNIISVAGNIFEKHFIDVEKSRDELIDEILK